MIREGVRDVFLHDEQLLYLARLAVTAACPVFP
jgi:hypothetical protein